MKANVLKLSDVRALHELNRWSNRPILEARLDCQGWLETRENTSSPFSRNAARWLPTFETLLAQTSPLSKGYLGEPPPLLAELSKILDEPESIAKVVELTSRFLQSLAGVDSSFGKTSQTQESHVYQVCVAYEDEQFARACLDAATELCEATANDQPFDLLASVRELMNLAEDVRLGPSSLAIQRAAMARGIPLMRLNDSSLVQLGEGCHQRRVWTAETDATSAIAESIAQDKDLTKRLLQTVGVPVPRGQAVQSAEEAWTVACKVGLPVTVKPRGANHARGISLDLKTREEVLEAYDWAVTDGGDTGVLVEQFVQGHSHRLLVIGHRLIAAATGRPEFVIGDGQLTISQLVANLNLDPRRGENYSDLLSVVKLDPAALIELRKQGYTSESIPDRGLQVLVQRVGDLTTDCTADVHLDNAAKAELAARVIGLDVAGIDVIAEDIGRPFADQRGAILEVNAGPSLSMHVAPLHGKPQPVGEAILHHLFPAGSKSRVPIIIVTGSGNRSKIVHELAGCLRELQFHVGWATSDEIRFDGEILATEIDSDFANLAALRLHPLVEVIVCESRPEQANARGVGCSHVDLAVVTCFSDSNEKIRSKAEHDPLIAGTLAVLRGVASDGMVVLPREPGTWVKSLTEVSKNAHVLPGNLGVWRDLIDLSKGQCGLTSHQTIGKSPSDVLMHWFRDDHSA